MIPRPGDDEYAPFYAGYVAAVPDGDVLAHLRVQRREMLDLLRTLSDAQAGHRYAPGKWSLKEVVGHVVDGERIFACRALRFARGDGTPLPGFDENAYVRAAEFDGRALSDLAGEYDAVRAATIALLEGFGEQALARRGEASGAEVSVRALAFIIAGHERHHLDLIEERYLPGIEAPLGH